MQQAMIESKGLCKRVRTGDSNLTILENINFSIQREASIAIMGISGSGKSTLLGLLAGLDVPTEGEVLYEGQAFSALSEDERAVRRSTDVGFVFQNFQLLNQLTALENVMLPLELLSDPQARSKAQQMLEKVGLERCQDQYPRVLSGGEQQRIGIARAYVTQPKILFADEPTGNLDFETGQQIADILFELNREHNTTLIFVTHDQQLAKRCQQTHLLSKGQLQG